MIDVSLGCSGPKSHRNRLLSIVKRFETLSCSSYGQEEEEEKEEGVKEEEEEEAFQHR